ncbi:MAG: DUF2753 family protein [Polaromonas sp.]|nr:DUF2753 family protein [Polaromonas sp.]
MDIQTRQLSTRPAAVPASLAQWERLMRSAQAAARMEQLVLSLATCWQALAVAQELVIDPPRGRANDCVAALVVSHHNLADMQLEAGGNDLAAEQLSQAHEALMLLLAPATGPHDPRHTELQQAAWRHSRETHAGLMRYLAEHGQHPAIARALRVGCMTLLATAPGGNTTRH